MTNLSRSDVKRLQAIKDQVRELMDEAKRIVRGTSEESRAHSYWFAHVRCALDDDHMYLGSSMCTMQASIDSLSDRVEPGDDDEDDEVDEDRLGHGLERDSESPPLK